MLNGKVMAIHLLVGLLKNILLYKVVYFSQIYSQKNQNKTWIRFF